MNYGEWLNEQITRKATENPNLRKAAKISYLKRHAFSLGIFPSLLKSLFRDPSWCNWVRCWAYIISAVSSPYSRGECQSLSRHRTLTPAFPPVILYCLH